MSCAYQQCTTCSVTKKFSFIAMARVLQIEGTLDSHMCPIDNSFEMDAFLYQKEITRAWESRQDVSSHARILRSCHQKWFSSVFSTCKRLCSTQHIKASGSSSSPLYPIIQTKDRCISTKQNHIIALVDFASSETFQILHFCHWKDSLRCIRTCLLIENNWLHQRTTQSLPCRFISKRRTTIFPACVPMTSTEAVEYRFERVDTMCNQNL